MTDLTKLVVRLEAEIGNYTQGMSNATKALQDFENTAKNALGDIAGSLAAFFTVDKAVEWGKAILDNADHLQKFSESTGVAVQTLSGLQFGLQSSGVPAEALDGIFRKLSGSISEAAGKSTSDAGVAFRLLGVALTDTNGKAKSTDQVILDLADKFAGMQDGANKSAIAVKLLGKAGAEAIPFLDQGAAGIEAFNKQAGDLGVLVSGETAKAAQDFNDQLNILKATLVDGIGNRIAQQVLPILKDLGDSFGNTGDKIQSLDTAADVVVGALKILATAGLEVIREFDEVGTSVGGAAAALAQIVQGHFSQASAIFKENDDDLAKQEASFQARYAAIWRDGGDDVLSEIKVTATKLKAAAPNLAAAIDQQKLYTEAIDALKKFAEGINEQVSAFGLGEAASVKYRLETGNLAKAVKDGGDAGLAYKVKIEAAADALQKLKDTKDITKALGEIQAQIDSFNGNDVAAAVAKFDVANSTLADQIIRQSDDHAAALLEKEKLIIIYQSNFNQLQQQAQQIESALAVTEEGITRQREAGAITSIQAENALATARKASADQLADVAAQETRVANQSGNQQQLQQAAALTSSYKTLAQSADQASQAVVKGFEDDAVNALVEFDNGTKSATDAFHDFVKSVAADILKLADQHLVESIFGSALGTGTAGGGFLSSILGSFGGGKADGGQVTPGSAYRVNENTPNSEWFVPNVGGSIVPADKMGGKNSTINISLMVPADNGHVSRATQQQMAAAAARAVATANRRFN